MDFLWFKMPDDYSRRNQTPFQQVKKFNNEAQK